MPLPDTAASDSELRDADRSAPATLLPDEKRRGSTISTMHVLGAFLLLSVAQWVPWVLLAVLPGDEWARMAAWVLGPLVFAVVVLWFRRAVLAPRGGVLGFGTGQSWRFLVLTGIAIGALVYCGVFVARTAIGAVTVDGLRDGGAVAAVLLAGLLLAGYQAVSEEIVFRGALFGMLPPSLSSAAVVAASVGVFVLYHLPKWESLLHGPYAIHLVLAGTAFAVAYLRTGSLWWGIGLHWGWNLGAYALLEAEQPLVRLQGLAAGGWGEAGSWLAVAGNAALLLVVCTWPNRGRPVAGQRNCVRVNLDADG